VKRIFQPLGTKRGALCRAPLEVNGRPAKVGRATVDWGRVVRALLIPGFGSRYVLVCVCTCWWKIARSHRPTEGIIGVELGWSQAERSRI